MTTLTTPEALALLDAEIASCGRLEPEDCENCDRIRQARAHLASRIAELDTLLTATTQRLSNAEAELAAAKVDAEWSAKMAEFIGPGALAYMWREFNAAREGK